MKTWRYGVAVSLLAGLGACSNMMGNNSQAPKAAAVTQPTVAPEMVKKVQSKLRDDGYYKQGAVDGVWGSGTETAVRAFQRDHNLGTSGQLDVATLQALNVTSGAQTVNETTQPTTTNGNPQPVTNNNANTQPMTNNPNSPVNTNPNPPPADNGTAPPTH